MHSTVFLPLRASRRPPQRLAPLARGGTPLGALLAALPLLDACATPCPKCPGAGSVPALVLPSPERPASSKPTLTRTLEIRLRALPSEKRAVAVTIESSGTPLDLASWIPPRLSPQGLPAQKEGWRFSGPRWAHTGAEHSVTYTVELEKGPFVALGDLVALPEAYEDRSIDARIVHDGGEYPVFASSAGVGDASITTTGRRLRQLVVAMGGGGVANFQAPEGEDTIVWLGSPQFDARAVGAELAGFRTHLYERFGEVPVPRETILFSVEPNEAITPFQYSPTPWILRRAPFSIVARIGARATYDVNLRLAMAEAQLQRFIGERLWLGDPKDPDKTAWFHKGFVRGLAMRELFQSGLLTAEEYAGLLSGHASIALFETTPALLSAARGVLYFHELTARLGGTDSIWAILRALYPQASKGPVPAEVWQTMVQVAARETPKDGFRKGVASLADAKESERLFREIVVEGKVNVTPVGCFGVANGPREMRRWGFDEQASVEKGSPVDLQPSAKRAGLLETDKIVSVDRKGDWLEVHVERGGKELSVSLPATRERKIGPIVSVVRGANEEKCREMLK